MSEEFKAILDLLQATGDASANLFIFYVAMDFLKLALGLGGLFGVCAYAIKALIMNSQAEIRLQYLRDLMCIGSPGRVMNGEYDRMVIWVKERK